MPKNTTTTAQPEVVARAVTAPESKDVAFPTKRAVIYLRVSTVAQANTSMEGDAYSISAQREACHRKAEALDAIVLDEYIDAGESARSSDRPQLQEMLSRLTRERDVDYVIVHKVDRLARNRADDVTINLAITKASAQLVSVSEAIDETPSGMLLHGIMSSIAEFYSQNLAGEIKKGMHQKAKDGWYPGLAPIGYSNIRVQRNGQEVRTIEIDPERGHLIAWAFEAYASGQYGLNQLVEALAAKGLRTRPTAKRAEQPLSVSALHHVLHNRVYIGIFKWGGIEHLGRHEPLVSIETFATVQALLSSRRQSSERRRAYPHYLKGTLYCARCGSRLSFTNAKGSSGGLYEYLYCLGRHSKRTICDLPYLSVDVVEALVLDRYKSLQVIDVTAERIRHNILDAMKDRTMEAEKLAQRERHRIQRLETERRKLLQAHLAGAIPLELLKEEQDRIASELANAGGALAATEINWINVENNLKQALGLASTFTTAYDDATPQIRRRINQAVFEKVHVDVDTATVTLTPAFAVLLAEDLLADLDGETKNSGTDGRYQSSNKHNLVEHVGVEPTTSCLQSRRSNQLS